MEITIEKSPIPVIWIDTSVIINFKKLRYGERMSQVDKQRAERLYHKLYELTRKRKLICPEGDQGEETMFGGADDEKKCHRVLNSLSLGCSHDHRFTARRVQALQVARAYAAKAERVVMSYRDVFPEDPVTRLKAKDPVVSAQIILRRELVSKCEREQRSGTVNIEALRKTQTATGVTFGQQLALEYTGLVQATRVAMQRMEELSRTGAPPTLDDSGLRVIIDMLLEIIQCIGSPEKAAQFLESEDFKAIPYYQISSHLWAEIVTSPTPVLSGDSMDIEQLSTIIPYCDLVISDRKMKNRLTRLGFDKKYRTGIYCMSEIDAIIGALDGASHKRG